MKINKIENELINSFSNEDIKLSLDFYTIKLQCLVTPYHSFKELLNIFDVNNFDILPERNNKYIDNQFYIQNIVNNKKDFFIITNEYEIIKDIIPTSLRILNKKGKILKPKKSTLLANMNDVRNEILGISEHKGYASDKVMKLIDNIKLNKEDKNINIIDIIGDSFLKNSLQQFIKQKNK